MLNQGARLTNSGHSRGDYFGRSGLRQPVYAEGAPALMAERLVKYISDASTVRARVLDHYGRAPKIEAIRKLRDDHLVRQEQLRAYFDVGEEESELEPFKPASLVKTVARTAPVAPVEIVLKVPSQQLHTASDVIQACARCMVVPVSDILGRSRYRRHAYARHLIAAVLKARGSSYPQIAARLKRDDHTTIMSGVRKFFSAVIRDERIAAAYDRMVPPAFQGVRTFDAFNALLSEKDAA